LNKYINIPSSDYLQKIIDYLHDLSSWPNICGAIDGTHVPLTSFPNKRMTFATIDFLIGKKLHIIVIQAICDVDKKLWNVYVGHLSGVHCSGQDI
jgi:hypothetical protein